jgi:hypothetical protein
VLQQNQSINVLEQAVWLIGNIAGDGHSFRDLVLRADILPMMLSLLQPECTPPMKLVRTTIWAVSNLCRGRPFPDMRLVAPILPIIANYLTCGDEVTRIDCCWCISYLSDGGRDRIARVLDVRCSFS